MCVTIEARCRLVVLALMLVVLPIFGIAIPVSADTSGAITIENPVGYFQGINVPPLRNTFYAAGRHWEMYINDATDLVYTSSVTGVAGTWTTYTVVTNTTLTAVEFSLFFDNTTSNLHYARNTSDGNQTLYGMGTPTSLGTITWNTEKVISSTNSTISVSICTDVDGYPWVAWYDEDIISPDDVLYIKSSSTKDGTWTDNVFSNITIPTDRSLGLFQMTPVQSGVYPRVEVDYASMNDTTSDVSLMAANTLDNFTYQYTIVPEGQMSLMYYAFSLNNLDGAGMTCIYTDTSDSLYEIERGSGNWTTAPVAVKILSSAAGNGTWIPTISVYNKSLGGYDKICIATNDYQVAYSIHPFGGTWSAWTYIWSTSGANTILRHTASYDGDISHGVPFGFTWQDLSGSVYYWWFTSGGLGYYTGSSHSTTFPMNGVMRFLIGAIFLACMVMGLMLLIIATPIKLNIMSLMVTIIMVVLCMIIGMAVINTLV